MAINVSDLPPKYQAQAMKKYMEQQKQRRGPAPPAAPPQDPAKGTKYHNTPTERVTASGAVLHFDSQKEARRFDALAARQEAGQIRDLRLQVDFTLQEAFTDTEGKRVRAIRYKADFTYYQPPNRQLYGSHAPYYAEQSGVPWEFVVEDVKSKATRTAKYAMKKKMLSFFNRTDQAQRRSERHCQRSLSSRGASLQQLLWRSQRLHQKGRRDRFGNHAAAPCAGNIS